jgi:acetyl esterase/lipase
MGVRGGLLTVIALLILGAFAVRAAVVHGPFRVAAASAPAAVAPLAAVAAVPIKLASNASAARRVDPASTQPVLHKDIVYQTIDGVACKLDVCVPPGNGPFPLVMWIHGGAWQIGDKSKFEGRIKEEARHGYVAATINYRFAPRFKFPAQLDDSEAALEFLVQNAAKYKIDPTRIATAGESAGAHLAMLIGFRNGTAKYPNLPKVRCIVNFFGPTDFTHWIITPIAEFILRQRFHKSFSDAMEDVLGTTDPKAAVVAAASPITYITSAAPPIITFHGMLDPIVPFQQAQLLQNAIKKAGGIDILVPIPTGMHGHWDPKDAAMADARAMKFLDAHLKGDHPAEKDH